MDVHLPGRVSTRDPAPADLVGDYVRTLMVVPIEDPVPAPIEDVVTTNPGH
jgi:hypothetical protein